MGVEGVATFAVNWFENARCVEYVYDDDDDDVSGIDNQKLGAIYQFIRDMPEFFDPAPAAGEKRKRVK